MIIAALLAITLGAALIAALVRDIRRATLALWIAGLGVGGVYLTIGAEMLAVIQWVVATLAAISFVFFAGMFGEYGFERQFFDRKRAVFYGLGVIAGVAFSGVIWLAAGETGPLDLEIPRSGNDLVAVGSFLTERHLLSLEILGITLLMALLGGGVLARPEARREGDAEK
ncbi:MAG: NADH-quinone oxidoreductase subunit J [Oligoflexia bacterium]|nr:NADH-quinone oxidoreductase subunit J [Oligoflexia bacterium]